MSKLYGEKKNSEIDRRQNRLIISGALLRNPWVCH